MILFSLYPSSIEKTEYFGILKSELDNAIYFAFNLTKLSSNFKPTTKLLIYYTYIRSNSEIRNRNNIFKINVSYLINTSSYSDYQKPYPIEVFFSKNSRKSSSIPIFELNSLNYSYIAMEFGSNANTEFASEIILSICFLRVYLEENINLLFLLLSIVIFIHYYYLSCTSTHQNSIILSLGLIYNIFFFFSFRLKYNQILSILFWILYFFLFRINQIHILNKICQNNNLNILKSLNSDQIPEDSNKTSSICYLKYYYIIFFLLSIIEFIYLGNTGSLFKTCNTIIPQSLFSWEQENTSFLLFCFDELIDCIVIIYQIQQFIRIKQKRIKDDKKNKNIKIVIYVLLITLGTFSKIYFLIEKILRKETNFNGFILFAAAHIISYIGMSLSLKFE